MSQPTVKERIVEAAWALFDEKGYDNVSVDEIINAASSSKGAFYHYFTSKDELLSALPEKFDADYDKWATVCDPTLHSADKIIGLARFVCKNMELQLSRHLITLIYSTQLTTKGKRLLIDENRKYFQLLNEYISQGQEQGEISTDIACTQLSQILDILLRGLIYDWCLRKGAYSLEALCGKILTDYLSRYRID